MKKTLGGLLFIGVGLMLTQVFWPVPTLSPFVAGQVDVIAHQGGNLEWPDSTRLAYDEAVEAGTDVLEMDVHLTLDGHVVVMHDERVDRTTNGQGAIRNMTLAHLKTLDAAYWWPYHDLDDVSKTAVPEDAVFPFRGQGEQIMTLAEMFEAYPNHRFVVELKSDRQTLRAAVLALLDRYDRWDSVLLASFYQETLQAVRREAPQAQTYGAEAEIRLFYVLHRLYLERLFPYDIDAFAIPMHSGGFDLSTPRFVQAARNAGILLHYWTINDDEDMQALTGLGVDGIITDRPSRLIDLQRP